MMLLVTVIGRLAAAPCHETDRADFIGIEGGRTRLVTLTTFEAQEQRDGMLQSGMEQGMDEGYKKLDGLLAKRQA